MDYGEYYWGLERDYYRDPFPSLLSYQAPDSRSRQLGPVEALILGTSVHAST